MFFQYTIILPDSQALLQNHHLHILYLLIPLSNSTLIFSLLTSITMSRQLSLQNKLLHSSSWATPTYFFPFRNGGFPLISSTHKMASSSIPPFSASITHPISSSQYPVPPEPCLLISMISLNFLSDNYQVTHSVLGILN